jgi:hypothetical protein
VRPGRARAKVTTRTPLAPARSSARAAAPAVAPVVDKGHLTSLDVASGARPNFEGALDVARALIRRQRDLIRPLPHVHKGMDQRSGERPCVGHGQQGCLVIAPSLRLTSRGGHRNNDPSRKPAPARRTLRHRVCKLLPAAVLERVHLCVGRGLHHRARTGADQRVRPRGAFQAGCTGTSARTAWEVAAGTAGPGRLP